jgi:hypothetical protein
MLLRESDADGTMLHDPSATWSSVDRGYPLSTPASLRTLLADALRLCPVAPRCRLASVEDRSPSGAGYHAKPSAPPMKQKMTATLSINLIGSPSHAP